MIPHFKDLKFRAKLMVLITTFCAGFLIFGLCAFLTLRVVQVNGPYYRQIVQGKDVIADVLPPPAYLIETILVAHQLSKETSLTRRNELIEKARKLSSEYDDRHNFWARELAAGELKAALVVKSHVAATELLAALNQQFLPAVAQGDLQRAEQVLLETLSPAYESHRKAVDEVVVLATARNREDEAEATAIVGSRTWILGLLCAGILLAVFWISHVISRSICIPLARTVKVLESVAQGDLEQSLTYQSRDEIGVLADTFRSTMSYMRELARAADRLCAGDLSLQLEAKSKQDLLSNSLNSTQQKLRQVVDETASLITAAREGRLDARGDAAKFQGVYAELVASLNHMMDAVASPLHEASEVLEKVADKDLSVRMQGTYVGDYAKISCALNTAMGNLSSALSQVQLSSEHVTSAAAEISSAGQNLASGASEQASSLQEVSSSVQELSSMTRQNTLHARETRDLSELAKESARRGVDNMRQLSEAIDRIKSSADKTAKIVKTIDEIAFQTNLLALNAAVEAARAGDAGKGFAVVAEEVRNLAMRSAEAAKSTAALIEASVHSAEQGVSFNQQVLQNLEEISTRVHKVSDVMTEIAAAGEQQSQGIEQINSAVDQISNVTQRNAAHSEETAASAEELHGQAHGLRQLVSDFSLAAETRNVTGGQAQPPHRAQQKRAGSLCTAPLRGATAFSAPTAVDPSNRKPTPESSPRHALANDAVLTEF